MTFVEYYVFDKDGKRLGLLSSINLHQVGGYIIAEFVVDDDRRNEILDIYKEGDEK